MPEKTKSDLIKKSCKPCEGGDVPVLNAGEALKLLKEIQSWSLEKGKLERKFTFKNYYETISFINAIAWIANKENHHPDICFGYKECSVSFMTYAVNGLTENDFISAAKINALFD